jgi:hypothetical protein
MTRRPVRAICRVLGIGKSTVYRARAPRPRRYEKAADREVHAQLNRPSRRCYASGRATATAARRCW